MEQEPKSWTDCFLMALTLSTFVSAYCYFLWWEIDRKKDEEE